MSQSLFLLIFFIEYHWVESQKLSYSYSRVNFICTYSHGKYSNPSTINIVALRIHASEPSDSFILHTDQKQSQLYQIEKVTCREYYGPFSSPCKMNFASVYLSFYHPIIGITSAFKIESGSLSWRQSLLSLSTQLPSNKNTINLTCTLQEISTTQNSNKQRDNYGAKLSTTSLVGIIFLCACVVLVFVFSVFWFATIYYRRFTQNRMEEKQRKALEKTTQQMLDQSPIITYDSNNEENDFNDADPMCAICLESFKNKEKLRKIVCGHYFHVTCIDPWLLSHQSCPLCNRNILLNTIPSISSNILIVDNERNIAPTAPTNDNTTNET